MSEKCPQARVRPTYHTNALAKNCTGGQQIQDMDATLERFHRLAITSKFIGAWSLLLKHGSHGLDRVAIFELVGERVFGEFGPGLFLIVAQSGIEECLEMRGRRSVRGTHIFRPVEKAQFGEFLPRIDALFVPLSRSKRGDPEWLRWALYCIWVLS